MAYNICIRIRTGSTADRALQDHFDQIKDSAVSLCSFLNQDSSASSVWWDRTGSKICVSTPRIFVVLARESQTDAALTAIVVRPADIEKWGKQKFRKSPLEIRWSPNPASDPQVLTDLINRLSEKAAGRTATVEQFWDYWEAFLEAEHEKVDTLRLHPGWPFLDRRHGRRGTIELYVPKCVDQIVAACRGRIRFRGTEDCAQFSAVPFEIQADLVRSDWIAVASLAQEISLKDIPLEGKICPDWSGACSLQRRRSTALKKLRDRDTAHPSLYDQLPNGPRDETTPAGFAPRLEPQYNAEQTEAIAKALVPGSITTVLGPPGTGKTQVIAEIATQVASKRGRVLIASQTNLAVDNALERLMNVEDVFVVRVGRSESVQLNPELILSASSSRYRERVRARSRRWWEEEQTWFRALTHIPDPDEIADVVSGLASFRAAQKAEAKAHEVHRANEVAQDICRNQLSNSEQNLANAREATGMTLEEETKLERLWEAISRAGLDHLSFIGREQALRFASEHRSLIGQIIPFLKQREALADKLNALTRAVSDALTRIRRADELDREIREKEARNADIELKRSASPLSWSATGMFRWLDNRVFTWKDDVADLKRERSGIDVIKERCTTNELNQRAFGVRGELNIVDTNYRNLVTKLNLRYVPVPPLEDEDDRGVWRTTLEIQRKLSSNQREEVARLERDIASADLLFKEYGSFKGATALVYRDKLASLRSIRETTLRKLTEAFIATESSHSALQVARQRCRSLSYQQFPERFRDIVPPGMNLDEPGDLASFEEVRSGLEQQWAAIRKRRDRLPHVKRVLSEYYDRLSSERLDVEEAIIADADVVAATCAGVAAAKEFRSDFDWVIIDEAGKADPLDLLVPMVRGKTIVLVGDHRQLPPVLDRELINGLSARGADKSVSEASLFERLFNGSHPSRKAALALQYRMVPAICHVVKELSYADTPLITAGNAVDRKHPFADFTAPVHWVRCEGEANRALKRLEGSASPENPVECKAIIRCLTRLYQDLPKLQTSYEVGVISMYRGQVDAIRRAVSDTPFLRDGRLNLQMDTVDSFQGRQKDAILVSLVETDPKRRAFFYDVRRINVALSRARELLIIVGMVDTLGRDRLSPFGEPNPLYILNTVFRQMIKAGSAGKEIFRCT